MHQQCKKYDRKITRRRRRIEDKRRRLRGMFAPLIVSGVVAMKRNISVNLAKRKLRLFFACAEWSHLEIWLRELHRMLLEAEGSADNYRFPVSNTF